MRGWSELALAAAVIAAAWTRTPLGALGHNAVALLRDQPTVDVFASYRGALPSRILTTLAEATHTPRDPLQAAVRAHLGDAALAELGPGLDEDPARALEIWAVGAPLRQRAIERARAAGASDPDLYSSHRAFLPTQDALRADRAVTEVLAIATALDLRWPVSPDAPISSSFGWREHPTLGTRRFHEGVDIAVPVGTAVHAAGPGVVIRSKEDAINGRHIIIAHGHGVTTAYCHGQALEASRQDRVQTGEVIMRSGSTGRSTGPHLHFGLRINGRPVDPSYFRPSPST